MVLSAILKLDAGAFTTPLGKAVEGIKAAIRIGGELQDKLQQAFDAGGELKDLSDQTGELPGTLMVLRQAFQDAGVGADALGQTLAIMRKSLGGISETGEPTSKIFKQLGLDMDALKSAGAQDQLAAIGSAISGLKTPAEQSAAAMAVFGRSGTRMLALLKDPEAMSAAAASLGGLPALMDRNARAFDQVSDRMAHIKAKGQGLWAGIAEGLLPLADQITATMDGIDFTSAGQKVGAFIGATVQLFKTSPFGQIIKDVLTVGFGMGINYGSAMFAKLGSVLWEVLSKPLADFSAALGFVIQEAMEKISKAPSLLEKYPILKLSPLMQAFSALGKTDQLKEFKKQSFDEIRKDALDTIRSMTAGVPDWGGKFDLIDYSEAENRLKQASTSSAEAYQSKIKDIQQKSNLGAIKGGNSKLEATKSDGKALNLMAPDDLTRIGGYLGTGNRMAGLAEQALQVARQQLASLREIERQRLTGGAVWAR